MNQRHWLFIFLQTYRFFVYQSSISAGEAATSQAIEPCDMNNKSLYEARDCLKYLHNITGINKNYSERLIRNMIRHYLKSSNFDVGSKITYAQRSTYLCLTSWFYEYFNHPVLIITDSSTERHVSEFLEKQNSQINLFSYKYANNTVFADILHWKVEGYKLFVFLCSLKCSTDIITMAANADFHDNKYIWVTDKREIFSYINLPENMLFVDVNSWQGPNPTFVECSYKEIKQMLKTKTYGLTIHKTHLETFPDMYYLSKKSSWLSLSSECCDITTIYLSEIDLSYRKYKTIVNIVTIIEPPFTTLSRVKPTLSGKICDIGKLCWVHKMLNETFKVKVPYCCIGFCMDLLNEIEKDLNIESNVYLVEDSVYGLELNGTYNGLIEDVLHGKADAILEPITMYEWRSKVIEFSEPYLTSGISIATVMESNGHSFFNFTLFFPISLNLWISTFAIAMIVSFFLWRIEYFVAKKNIYPWRESILYQIGLVFQRDMGGKNPMFISTRIIALCGALFMMILMSSYTAMLTANKVKYSHNLPIAGFKDDKITSPTNDFIYATLANSGISQMFRDSSSADWTTMYGFMKKHNFVDTENAFKDLKSGKLNAIIQDTTILQYYASIDQNCGIQIAGDPIPDAGYSIAMPKGSPLKSKFDNLIREYKTRGLIKKLEERWLPNSCLSKSQEHTIDQAEINSFGGLFVVLIAACFLAIAIFIAEHMVWAWYNSRIVHLNSIQISVKSGVL
ncbi:glutamate receptor ionotropic, NMDA 3A-like [Hydractinia symbiolongicarpus]|uniref:glutamate receptor ionotropic, NMDA 3A-like n=1 Tax=Hydractinia symbiolongicarpus TaxID=13093 RepID=UPI00254EE853|nr:glutamate receptor ionotropic, NMDA 3A-like [Hydractinia symbiolongicarpus]